MNKYENAVEGKPYYISPDIGTNSLGYAVTDTDYRLLKAKGKDMWGVVEFSEAETAAKRRGNRTSRRGKQRAQIRNGILRYLFEDTVLAEDPNFYARMDNSFYKKEDKDPVLTSMDTLFADKDYHDEDYFKEYPTISHLKYALIKDEVAADNRYARKLYLAILHYFDKRGHFLNKSLSGESDAEDIDISESLYLLDKQCEELFDFTFSFCKENIEAIKDAFIDDSFTRSERRIKMMEILQVEKKDVTKYLILGAICGLKVNLAKMLDMDNEEKIELDFTSSTLDEKLPEILNTIGEEYEDFLACLKGVYDNGVLVKILSGETEDGSPVKWLSQARVLSYEKHKKDLSLLKACIKEYCSAEEYDYLFRSDTDASYSAYVGSVNSDKVKVRRGDNLHNSKAGDRYVNLTKRIQKDLAEHADDERVAYILKEIEKETFLPKQMTCTNAVIPHQLHERELRKILENAEKHLPFLSQVTEIGLSAKDIIISLFNDCVPYFVGPLSQAYKGNGWAVRNPGMDGVQVYPWNIEEVFDYNATSEQFIMKMVRCCSYIFDEKVLPKESMLYQSFMVLDTINDLQINNEKISCQLKQDIYHKLFEQEKKNVTWKMLVKYLTEKGLIKEDSELSGIDPKAKIGPQLTTYKKFYAIFGEDIQSRAVRSMIEDIVKWGTIFGESKKMFKKKLEEDYGDKLNVEQIDRISGFKFKKWGNLSREFLMLKGQNKRTKKTVSFIRTMWADEDNPNLMELLYSKNYTFSEELQGRAYKTVKTLYEFDYSDLDDTYYSAPVKRMIWQTIKTVREIEKTMGYPPKRIFVEVTRSNGKKGDEGRTVSREKELLKIYKGVKDGRDWETEIKEAAKSGALNKKKVYLYYKQLGCDAYTGLPIDKADLECDDKYDIDHIYPKHFVFDDSLHNNRVLVSKPENQLKGDGLVRSEVRNNPQVRKLWDKLRKMKLMSEEKYRRLIRSKPFTDEEKISFINRQIVETGQAATGVCRILKMLLPQTEIVYSKAEHVSQFRKEFGFYKSRLVNNFHHAHDAYLNIVVGNIYLTKFANDPEKFIKKEKEHYNLGRMFNHDVERNGYCAWHAPVWDKEHKEIIEENETLRTVRETLKRNTPLTTRVPFTQHGKLFDTTICSAKKAKERSYFSVKTSNPKLADVEKYGGYGSIRNAYFFVVEHEVKGKGKEKGEIVKTRTIEPLPIYKVKEVAEKGLLSYCEEIGLVNPKIIMPKLKLYSLISLNGHLFYFAGKGSETQLRMRNAYNLIIDDKWNRYIRGFERVTEDEAADDVITSEGNIALYDELTRKHTEGIYSKQLNPIGDILISGREKFVNLELNKQIYVLKQILGLSIVCGPGAANLKEIGGSPNAGVMNISKDISKYSEAHVITQSITGLIRKRINLLS